jgi:predicted secreted protein
MHIAGKNGAIYTGATVVEDCEDVWVQGTADTTVSAETTSPKVGTKFVRGTTVSVGANTLLMYEDISSKDISSYDGIYFWFRSSVNAAAGDLQFLIDEGTGAAAPEESINLPPLVAATWRRCFCKMVAPTALNAVLSVGIKQITDLANGTFDIDDVEAIAEVDGVKSWTIDYTADTLETTDFGSAGVKEYIIAGSGWSGTFEGLKDGVPLGIGSQVLLVLGESDTVGNNWIGDAFITGVSASVAHDGIVGYSYTFQGSGALETPAA